MQLTEMESKALDCLIEKLTGEVDFSDVAPEDIAEGTCIPMKSLRGVLASLAKKGVIYVYERPGDCSIVYLEHAFYHLHPTWANE